MQINISIKRIITVYLIASALLALSATNPAMAADYDSQPVDSAVLQLDDSTINETLARYPFFVLDVYKPLCNPCQRMETAVHELSVELGDQAVFGMMHGPDNPLTEERYNVTGYPTLLVFDNGTLIDKSTGFASKKYIVDSLHTMKKDLDINRATFSE